MNQYEKIIITYLKSQLLEVKIAKIFDRKYFGILSKQYDLDALEKHRKNELEIAKKIVEQRINIEKWRKAK